MERALRQERTIIPMSKLGDETKKAEGVDKGENTEKAEKEPEEKVGKGRVVRLRKQASA